jgi:hypothetical protein
MILEEKCKHVLVKVLGDIAVRGLIVQRRVIVSNCVEDWNVLESLCNELLNQLQIILELLVRGHVELFARLFFLTHSMPRQITRKQDKVNRLS